MAWPGMACLAAVGRKVWLRLSRGLGSRRKAEGIHHRGTEDTETREGKRRGFKQKGKRQKAEGRSQSRKRIFCPETSSHSLRRRKAEGSTERRKGFPHPETCSDLYSGRCLPCRMTELASNTILSAAVAKSCRLTFFRWEGRCAACRRPASTHGRRSARLTNEGTADGAPALQGERPWQRCDRRAPRPQETVCPASCATKPS